MRLGVRPTISNSARRQTRHSGPDGTFISVCSQYRNTLRRSAISGINNGLQNIIWRERSHLHHFLLPATTTSIKMAHSHGFNVSPVVVTPMQPAFGHQSNMRALGLTAMPPGGGAKPVLALTPPPPPRRARPSQVGQNRLRSSVLSATQRNRAASAISGEEELFQPYQCAYAGTTLHNHPATRRLRINACNVHRVVTNATAPGSATSKSGWVDGPMPAVPVGSNPD